MTRLTNFDIANISANLKNYDQELFLKAGLRLKEIAAKATQKDVTIEKINYKVAVIPMTCGQGVIEGFAETVRDIIKFLGFNAFVCQKSDVAGFVEALDKRAKIILMADDEKFIAYNLENHKISDNDKATAKGYVIALDSMVKGVQGKDILLLGAGRVGSYAAFYLTNLGAHLAIYDIEQQKALNLARKVNDAFNIEPKIIFNLDDALKRYDIIFDATPAPQIINEQHLSENKFIAAPGIPLGVKNELIPMIQQRLIHDPLQIGVATMIYDVL
ncbi:3-methylornithyl-N6-L-lysine dehydrogenase PylD [Carboxydothermus ferrireducens]|uniref:Pyrrolysine biosynthesis protein PylD n=1 Tax=Carboxydothermus ferrireducens DSM 11255 TaxID=1119529 RepID=A0ABX2RBF4_9THEO|nr:3-methylornithyl-N6-L-lysine dehydrogenase PylD [Carboxydothermus ferrireducens]NYE58502.1 pyrrolysine biosynthesis protein PylD [Carboxydothermus ferrireducens DSM 11255]